MQFLISGDTVKPNAAVLQVTPTGRYCKLRSVSAGMDAGVANMRTDAHLSDKERDYSGCRKMGVTSNVFSVKWSEPEAAQIVKLTLI